MAYVMAGPRAKNLIGVLLVAATLCWTSSTRAETITSAREAAVLRARAGDLPGAISTLKSLHQKNSENLPVTMDLAVLLYQAGQAKAATDVFEQAGAANPPEYALFAMTRAYRDQQRFDVAERLANQGAQRFPANPDWIVIDALILADTGRSSAALQLLASPGGQKAAPLERKLAEAYAYLRYGQKMNALRSYMEALHLAPGNHEARAEAAGLLREMGGANGAAALTDATPPLVTGMARRPLSADQAAAMVRWGGDLHPVDPANRFKQTDAALARIDQLISESAADPKEDPNVLRRLRLDRIIALRDRVLMNEVVIESQALSPDPKNLPLYVQQAYADALLYLHRPEEAAGFYRLVLEGDPQNLQAIYGLFYAEVESEDFDGANQTIDQLSAHVPPWRRYVGDNSLYPNFDYADALLAAGMARLFGNQLSEAQDRIAPLAAAAPANPDFRLANANVMDARGWPRQADIEARIAKSLAPTDPGIEKMLASLDIERHRLSEASARIQRLEAMYPEDLQVQRLAAELAAENSALFEIEVTPNWTFGSSSNHLGNELSLDAKLWSPPIDGKWRAFALDSYSYAHPDEGFVDRNRTGGGIELRLPDVTITAYGTYSTGELDKPGGGGSINWWVNDYIELGLQGEIFSINTPLRALFSNTTANEISGSFTYRWSESSEVAVSGGYLDFTDGNDRFNGGINGSQRLIDIPHFDLTGRASVWASSNSRTNVDYYSPGKDLTATVGLLAEHILWRSYDDSLVQRFFIDTGAYAEENHGTSWLGIAGYEHEWRFDPMTSFHYGVQLSRNVYDGDPEYGVAGTFGLSQRF